jgi:hypothetical protein
MLRVTRAHARIFLPLFVTIAMCAGPAAAADPPHFDCGKGLGVLFCPLKIPAFIIEGQVFLAAEFMERGERIAYPTLDSINFFGQLISETTDRIIITEGLIVNVTEDLLPGVVLTRTIERAVGSVTGNANSVRVGTSATQDLLTQTRPRPEHPAVLDYGKAVTEQSQKK